MPKTNSIFNQLFSLDQHCDHRNNQTHNDIHEHICDYGCGRPARYQFKNGKFCCNQRVTCQDYKPSNRLSTDRILDENDHEICSYGCRHKAIIQFKNLKYCCSKSFHSCTAHRKKVSETHKKIAQTEEYKLIKKLSIEKAKTDIGEDGLNPYQRASLSVMHKLKNDVDETGLNGLERKARKAINTQRNEIQDNGKSKLENKIKKWHEDTKENCLLSVEYRKNTLDENGNNLYVVANLKAAESARKNIDENGISSVQKGQEKRRANMLKVNPETGLNKFEQHSQTMSYYMSTEIEGKTNAEIIFEKALLIRKYKNTDLTYQGSYEKDFLENLESKHGIKWLKKNVNRGITFNYIDPNRPKIVAKYFSDYKIDNIIYEIKSSYTWDKHGDSNETRNQNIAKLNSAKDAGYQVILVIDHEEMNWNEIYSDSSLPFRIKLNL